MTGRPIDLDGHRGIAAQKATELRRLQSGFAAEQARLKARQDELEKFMLAAPAANWVEAVEKASYLLRLFAATSEGQDPRRKQLVANVLDDFDRLVGTAHDDPDTQPREIDMAKGQKRSAKEPRKQKSADKKTAGPKYLRPLDLGTPGKPGTPRPGGKR